MEHQVVAHMLDERLITGSSYGVAPDRPVCHDQTPNQGTLAVPLSLLKALFFVRDLAGDPHYRAVQVIGPADPPIPP